MVRDLFGDDDAPELYSDSIRIAVGAYGFALDFGIQGMQDTPMSELPPVKRQAVIRMSPHHALIFSKLLQKNIAAYQEKMGRINLPDELYKQMGLEPD